ncbi:MAG: sulfate adenylyltransferase [Thermoplasmatales archaeon]|nr:sulfate adenylyltransferase [Thermoplasmatales archaeon]MCW6170294.1 sulfate adenylyltransferase [Thermoplasmatales archaeon]
MRSSYCEGIDLSSEVNSKKSALLTDSERRSNSLEISKYFAMDAEKIGTGAYKPLGGFMDENEINSVLTLDHLPDGKTWTVPIFLHVENEQNFKGGDEIFLEYRGETFASMRLESIFKPDVRDIASRLYMTEDKSHPGVKQMRSFKGKFLSGKLTLLSSLESLGGDPTPEEVKKYFREQGWKTIAGYQTRNPPHIAHEYIQRIALEIMDGLFINPVVGELKPGDFDENTIMESYRYITDNFYPHDRVLLRPLHVAMRYAGPKAAAFFAIIRRNYGCTHFLIGRDMAGVGKYYSPYAAQEFVSSLDLGINIIPFKEIYYCKKCATVVSERSCRHGIPEESALSMSRIRDMIRAGKRPPDEVMRKEIVDILTKALQ